MKARIHTSLCAALLSLCAAAPALAQSAGRGEDTELRRPSEREREGSREDGRSSRAARLRDETRDELMREAGAGPARDGANAAAADRDAPPRDEPRDGARDGARDDAQGAPPARDAEPAATGSRSWLARDSSEPAIAPRDADSGTSAGLTLGAVLLVLGLAAAAIAMRFRKRDALPLAPSEARLTVLSSSRVGPKAFAVTAHVHGRVLLLGVTDHSVTNLGWLDTREPNAAEAVQESPAEAESEEELPDDYPGSALRAARVPTFASSSRLERFQEVLRGAEEARADLPMRPSYAPAPLDAAALLAAQTTDVVTATPPAVLAKTPQPAAVSLRRKRRVRESLPPREPRAGLVSRASKSADPSLEGQVAGLRALRNGG